MTSSPEKVPGHHCERVSHQTKPYKGACSRPRGRPGRASLSRAPNQGKNGWQRVASHNDGDVSRVWKGVTRRNVWYGTREWGSLFHIAFRTPRLMAWPVQHSPLTKAKDRLVTTAMDADVVPSQERRVMELYAVSASYLVPSRKRNELSHRHIAHRAKYHSD